MLNSIQNLTIVNNLMFATFYTIVSVQNYRFSLSYVFNEVRFDQLLSMICRAYGKIQQVFKRTISTLPRRRIKDLLQTTATSEVSKNNVTVQGWVKAVRKHKSVTFLNVTDGSCLSPIQVVLTSEEHLKTNVSYGCSVEIRGQLTYSPEKKQNVELLCESMNILQPCDAELYPFKNRKQHPMEYIRQFPHLRTRHESTAALLRIRSRVANSLHSYFQKLGFTQIHTPIITSNDCEGAGELFRVVSQEQMEDRNSEEFFSCPTFLTVSSQLHLEACACGIGDVYTLSPCFRAERSRPRTHLSEFYMLEIELAFCRTIDPLMEVLENSVQHAIHEVLEHCEEDCKFMHDESNIPDCFKLVEKCANQPFVKMDYNEAIKVLKSHSKKLKTSIAWGSDLNAEQEQFLTKHCGDHPVFVMNFPTDLRPFYVLENEDTNTAASFDLLFPHCGELAGGTVREDRYPVLYDRLQNLGLVETYQWYLDLRRFGGIPHGGYGLGFERLLRFILGVNNIRDVVAFPRSSNLCQM